MPTAEQAKVIKAMDELRGNDDFSIADVLSLAQISMEAMQASVSRLDSALCQEFSEIAKCIARTKEEVSQLQAKEMSKEHIPEAGRELDAVVGATEEATTQIMECAEKIMAADSDDIEAYKETVNTNIMMIFEACSFQDLTGQRIGKVVDTINHIDKRVRRFADAVGIQDADGAADEAEAEKKQRKEDLMLNGPQMEGDGQSQEDIDALFD